MSEIRVNTIKGEDGISSVNFATGATATGVVTATTFHGNITGVAATFTGVVTYEDVTSIDSVGIVTAREGILVGAGKSVGIGTVTPGVGIGLEVHNTEATGAFINVKSKSNTLAGINFGDFEDDNIGAIKYSNGSNTLRIFANAGEKYRIGEAGQFGIGGATYGSSGQVLTSGGASAAPTWAAAAGGKILQTQIHVLNDATVINSNTTTYVDTGLTKNITPAATSNLILVIANLNIGCDSWSQSGVEMQLKLDRGGTEVAMTFHGSWTDVSRVPGTLVAWDSTHDSTSALTYKIQFRRSAAYSGTTNAFVHHGSKSKTASLLLMEITPN